MVTFDDLPQALAWLDAHIDFESAMPTRRSLPTLDRMRALTGLLGDPQQAYPAVHITGTNGKGSTAAMATALLGAQGLTVGTYTSPNLTRVNERISRNGEPIDDGAFVEVLESLARLEPLMDDPPTRFELLTAAALAWFADEAVDVAVIEVGLGGRWDCTNVVDGDVAVLTNISFDHTEVLGPTLEDIARDKSGIFKPGSRVVIGETDPTLVALLRAGGGRRRGVRGVGPGPGLRLHRQPDGRRGPADRRPHPGRRLRRAAGARCTVPTRGTTPPARWPRWRRSSGHRSSEEWWRRRSPRCGCPGRLEVVGRHPLVVVDGAHNVAGMIVLARSLVEEFAVDGEAQAVVGMLTGRDPTSMLEALIDRRASARWWPVPPTPPGRCPPRWWPKPPPGWAWR